MEKVTELIEKAKVVAQAAVTWLVFASVVLTFAAGEIASVVPGETGETITEWVLRIVAWIGVAVGIIRRVTPVAKDERGLLPPLP